MKRLRLTLLVGTIAGALPLAAAMAQPANAPTANAPTLTSPLLAQADAPPVPPEAMERKKQLEEKVAPKVRSHGSKDAGEDGSKGERPSRGERSGRSAPDEAAPRAERPSRGGDAIDEMKRKSRAIDEAQPEPAPKPKAQPKAEKPEPKAAPAETKPAEKPESAPKTLETPKSETPPTTRPDARLDARPDARSDKDRKATDGATDGDTSTPATEKAAPKAAAPTTAPEKAPEEKAPEEKSTSGEKSTNDKATETERQIRGTGDATDDTRARDRDRDGRNRDASDRDRDSRDRDRAGRDRDGRDNDIRDEADYRNRNRDFDKRFDRREERQGDRVVIKEKGDRTIIREGDRTIIRHDEDDRLRRHARDVRRERRGDEFVTIIERPNGVQIVTYSDRDGRMIRRVRRQHGRDIVLIDNRHSRPDYDVYVELPPLRLDIPRDEYIVEADRASYDDIRGALIAPPVAPIQQNYTLDQVRSSVSLRERVRSVDLNTINFAFGDWHVPDSQVDQLENIAKALGAIIEDNPDEVFLIEGHTDAVGSEIDNLSLSDRRAEEVAAALTQDYQIPPENLVTQGYGEQYLKVDTEEANADNRRVVVRRITPLLKANAEQ